jgi:ATP-binding cassette subfamily C (CFTR/MRP) protein 1
MEIHQKLLEPFSIEEPRAKPPPEVKAKPSVPSGFCFFWWVVPILKLARNTVLEQSHLPDLREAEKSTSHNLTYTSKRLMRGMMRHYKWELLVNLLLDSLSTVLSFIAPAYIMYLDDYLNSDRPDWEGYISLGVISVVIWMTMHIELQGSFRGELLSVHMKVGLINLIFEKTLRAVAKTSVGNAVNVLQVDSARVYECIPKLAQLLLCPLQMAVAVYLLIKVDGTAGLIGTAIFVVMLGLNAYCFSLISSLNDKIMKAKDERIKETNELFTNIKFLKFFAWEQAILKRLLAARHQEIKGWRTFYHYCSLIIMGMWMTPVATAVLIFLYYIYVMGEPLTAATAFVTLSVLSILQSSISRLPDVLTSLIQALTSAKRIEEFLEAPEISSKEELQPMGALQMEGASFAFAEDEILKDLTMTVREGELVGLVGPVGSGKSALIAAVMGEMRLTKGQYGHRGSIAYASGMEAWVFNATLRDNITFLKPYDPAKFAEVVRVCSLESDLALLPSRDLTEIGEKGINLSGGQKARVALARAVYADADIYLLDDPLSSVDAHVGAFIFNECIRTYLKGKTIIVSTHMTQFIPQFDLVLYLHAGAIVKSGMFELSPELASLSQAPQVTPPSSSDKLIEEEDREVGSVRREVYETYFRYCGGKAVIIGAVLVVTIWQCFSLASSVFLEKWGDSANNDSFIIAMYCSLGIAGAIFVYFRYLILLLSGVTGSLKIHDKAVEALVKAPVNLFFDVTPLGRILNRLTKDMDEIDASIAWCLDGVLLCIAGLVGAIAICLVYAPYMITIVPIIGTSSLLAQQLFLPGQREVSRLSRISKSPMVSHFSATLTGVQSIRGYQATGSFKDKHRRLLDESTQSQFFMMNSGLWLTNIMNYQSFLVFIFIATYFTLFRDFSAPGITYLCLTYATSLADWINYSIKCYAWLETNIVAVERATALTEVAQEAPYETSLDTAKVDWPCSARIKFCEVVAKYRPGTPEVLKGIDFEINSGEKVGIVGRTGSGKSTLTLVLFRIIELHKGCILIDGVDTSSLGLSKLRKALSIIPQESVLFRGNLRFNLDPFDECSDEALQAILSKVKLSKSLDSSVDEGGSNFSSGERQLVCVARAALKNTKILILDEATAAVDRTNDENIQLIIRESFAACTILTIAHRLETILDNDRVLVLDAGKVVEFDSPNVLLKDPSSAFYSLHASQT